jgi:hypothetical protein
MPEAVTVSLKCLGCGSGPYSTSIGLDLTEDERIQSAEAYCGFCLRHCRDRHLGGVEARFSDDPGRRLLLTRSDRFWSSP